MGKISKSPLTKRDVFTDKPVEPFLTNELAVDDKDVNPTCTELTNQRDAAGCVVGVARYAKVNPQNRQVYVASSVKCVILLHLNLFGDE